MISFEEELLALRAEVARLKLSISDCSPRWISTDERNPDDEQTVLGCWQGSSTIEGMMSLTYYAEDAEDGPEVWRDSWGEKTDPPTHWTLLAMPGDALTMENQK